MIETYRGNIASSFEPNGDSSTSPTTEISSVCDPYVSCWENEWDQVEKALLDGARKAVPQCEDGAPNRTAYFNALRWLSKLRNRHPSAPPTTVIPEPAGGIILERRWTDMHGNRFVFEITSYNDGKSEYVLMRNEKILEMLEI